MKNRIELISTWLIGQQEAHVTKIISGWPGEDRTSQFIEERISVEGRERLAHGVCPARTINRAAIDDSACGLTVAVDAVGTRAQHRNVFSRYLFGAGEGKLLVASSDTPFANGNRHLAAGDQADTGVAASQLAQTVKQMSGSFIVRPVVA